MDAPTSLAEWNSALVKVLFLRPDRTRTTLSRIDVTGRIFEELSGGKGREAGKRSFIKAFGRDPEKIREQFKSSPRIAVLTRKDGIPPNFSALYLSLLAASADDDTSGRGQFRDRFALLLGIDELRSFGFQELPELWREFARWCKSRSARLGDCAQLLLPDPQHEKRIGHSKRLAFPSYKDEKLLRRTLAESGVDGSSPFLAVSQCVHAWVRQFSQNFIDELSIFRSLVHSASMQEAYDSPFWGAVRDITWEEEKQLKKNGHFCVQLDPEDPLYPEISLLSDEVGACALEKSGSTRLPRNRGIYTSIWSGSGLKQSIEFLLTLASKNSAFARSRPGAALAAGCLPFFHDSMGSVSSDGRYFDGGPCYLLVRSRIAPRIQAVSVHLRLQYSSLGSSTTLGDWSIFFFSAMSRVSLDRLAMEVTAAARRFLTQGWMPAQPRIAGGARYGQAILLTPASNPIVRLEDVKGGQFAITGESNTELAAGELVCSEDGLYIPPSLLAGLRGQLLCRYTLKIESTGRVVALDVPVIDEVPPAPLRTIGDRHAWLADGPLGTLETLADLERPHVASRSNLRTRCVSIRGASPLLKKAQMPVGEHARVELHEIAPALDWLGEALSLRYQKRATLPFEELKGHLRMAAEATGIPDWKLRRALFVSGWLKSVESRLSTHTVAIAGERTISWTRKETGVVVRIRGMLTKYERCVLQQSLSDGEHARRLASRTMPLSVGCIEIELCSEDRAAEIAAQFGLRFIDPRDTASDALGGLMQLVTKAFAVPASSLTADLTMWDEHHSRWVAETAQREQMKIGAILKAEGKQRNVYFIKEGNEYRRTDSFIWALMIKAAGSPEGLGSLADNGDVDWAKQIIGMPDVLCRWWMHFGGGVLAIADDGRFAFRGGKNRNVWDDIAVSARGTRAGQDESRASVRRTLALKLLKGRRARSV